MAPANRLAQRLVGNFSFSNGQRSFDGIDGKIGGSNWDLTAMAARATQGSFNMNANPEQLWVFELNYKISKALSHPSIR